MHKLSNAQERPLPIDTGIDPVSSIIISFQHGIYAYAFFLSHIIIFRVYVASLYFYVVKVSEMTMIIYGDIICFVFFLTKIR